MSVTDQIYQQLRTVNDPELNVNVVDLGLIYDVSVSDSQEVTITMTLTTPGCPLHDSIVGGVKHAVARIEEIRDVHVHVVWSPSWSPDRMTPEGKRLVEG